MTLRALTPIEQAAEALTPNRVNYEIRVVWPTGEPSCFEAINLPLEQAANRLEVLAEELRQAAAAERVVGRQEGTRG